MRVTKRKNPEVTLPFVPSGSFIETEKGFYYIVSPTKRYRVTSERVLASWSPQRVIKTTEKAVAKYKVAAKLKFRNGSLIWNISDGKIYLIENGKRRWVKSPDWLTVLGGTPLYVSNDEINLHEIGEDLT